MTILQLRTLCVHQFTFMGTSLEKTSYDMILLVFYVKTIVSTLYSKITIYVRYTYFISRKIMLIMSTGNDEWNQAFLFRIHNDEM